MISYLLHGTPRFKFWWKQYSDVCWGGGLGLFGLSVSGHVRRQPEEIHLTADFLERKKNQKLSHVLHLKSQPLPKYGRKLKPHRKNHHQQQHRQQQKAIKQPTSRRQIVYTKICVATELKLGTQQPGLYDQSKKLMQGGKFKEMTQENGDAENPTEGG